MEIRFLSAVIIRSPRAEALADFYGRLGVNLEASDHAGPGTIHFECQLGDVHFALHQADITLTPVPSVKIAFAVHDLDAVLARLRDHTDMAPSPIVERGFARSVSLTDPDGNLIELTELSNSWLEYLSSRPADRRDITAASPK
jgi:predicted enzyme related to lactoylglutathione lyase